MIDESHKAFAARAKERREERARATQLAGGAVDAAWQATYRLLVGQFGKPDNEVRDDVSGSFFVSWGSEPDPVVVFDLGLVYRAMQAPTRRAAIVELVRQHERWISAKRTAYSFVVTCPQEHYADLVALERWSVTHGHPATRVFNESKADRVMCLVRSSGPVDWFGRETAQRPVVPIEIP